MDNNGLIQLNSIKCKKYGYKIIDRRIPNPKIRVATRIMLREFCDSLNDSDSVTIEELREILYAFQNAAAIINKIENDEESSSVE